MRGGTKVPVDERALIGTDRADEVSFGRIFIANPDLLARFKRGTPLAKPDYPKLPTGEEQWCIDYTPFAVAS